jgi:hypothetical protein
MPNLSVLITSINLLPSTVLWTLLHIAIYFFYKTTSLQQMITKNIKKENHHVFINFNTYTLSRYKSINFLRFHQDRPFLNSEFWSDVYVYTLF